MQNNSPEIFSQQKIQNLFQYSFTLTSKIAIQKFLLKTLAYIWRFEIGFNFQKGSR